MTSQAGGSSDVSNACHGRAPTTRLNRGLTWLRIRSRAGDAGLELVSETVGDDQEVTMVLNVRAGA